MTIVHCVSAMEINGSKQKWCQMSLPHITMISLQRDITEGGIGDPFSKLINGTVFVTLPEKASVRQQPEHRQLSPMILHCQKKWTYLLTTVILTFQGRTTSPSNNARQLRDYLKIVCKFS